MENLKQNLLKKEIPEIYYSTQKEFPEVLWGNIIITYYPYIYASKDINDIKFVHELVHIKQQKDYGVKEWWARYLQDKDFRLDQELEAYRTEIAFIKDNIKDRNERYILIRKIRENLSAPMYGNMITFEQATKLLQ